YRLQIVQYGFTDTDTGHYEEDHIISLENGGHPRDPKNLYPEAYNTEIDGERVGAHEKDKVEKVLSWAEAVAPYYSAASGTAFGGRLVEMISGNETREGMPAVERLQSHKLCKAKVAPRIDESCTRRVRNSEIRLPT